MLYNIFAEESLTSPHKTYNMKVLKFGGTSVGSAERMKEVAQLILPEQPCIVVLSAMAGTTDRLVDIASHLYRKDHAAAWEKVDLLEKEYEKLVDGLYSTDPFREKGLEMVRSHFRYIRSFTQDLFTMFEEKAILAQGELISTALFHFYLDEQGIRNVLLPALNFMRIDREQEPDEYYIRENLQRELAQHTGESLFITQGYICRNVFGETDNLRRGGSDYSASLIGAAAKAKEIQIWTDIDGMHNNDPRYVHHTRPIERLSFEEAAELAYFGAKILHPTSIQPARGQNIPVRLKNTINPSSPGTLITEKPSGSKNITAVAAKDGITAIKIKSTRMLLAYGFLRKVFEVFESYKTPIDMIATSEVGVSVTIDQPAYLAEITAELRKYGTVEVDSDQVIICVVGDLIASNKGMAFRIFNALREIPVRMISYGGSNHNVSILVAAKDKVQALQSLNDHLF